MRKAFVLLMILILTLLASCHSHTFAEGWTSNDDMHWHAATCQHDLKKDEAVHTIDKGVCTVCGRNVVSGRWVVDSDSYLVYIKEVLLENLGYYGIDETLISKEELDATVDKMIAEVANNIATFKIELFDDGEGIVYMLGEEVDSTYRVTHQGVLYMTVDGDEERIGSFDESYKSFTMEISDDISLRVPLIKAAK